MHLFSRKKSPSPSLKIPMPEPRLSFSGSRRSSQSSTGRRSPFSATSRSPVLPPAELSATTPTEAPPAYTPRGVLGPPYPVDAPSTSTPSVTVTSDSPYAFLGQFDTIFLIDDSGSMAGRSWRETQAALASITPICTAHDADGLDIYFLNHRNPRGAASLGGYTKVTTPSEVQEIFTLVSPQGGTPTGRRLSQILIPYLQRLESAMKMKPSANIDAIVRPLNIIVITDGVPTDDVESVIVSAARKLDSLNAQPWQVGIQFFQVGNEPEAAEDLRDLDDTLSEQKGIRDMVDTVPYTGRNGAAMTGESILKVVLGSVHKKYDRRNASGRRERSTQR